VMNLVINASEAIGDRPGLVEVSTGVRRCERADFDDRTLPEGPYVFLEVSDTGSGMGDEVKARIFDPFFTTKFTGRGLGLAGGLGIVRGHRGTIQCRSELGKGTTFTAYFPLSAKQAPAVAAPTTAADGWRGSGSVLVVDDEETVLGLARHMLTTMGFSVLT